MSDIQIGDQSSKPQDLEKTEMILNAVIESEVKKQMSSLKGLEKMTKNANGGSDFFGGGGGGGSSFFGGGGAHTSDNDSSPTSLFMSGPAKKKREKGSVSLQQWRATKDSFTGAQRSRHEIKSRERVAESAFAGRLKSKCKYSTGSARELVEDCNELKAKWAWLPKGLVANKDMLSAFGFNHLKEAHDAIQAEKMKPALQAVISGTANDMEKFQTSFKAVDEGVKETVYANASTTMKQKLNPLMSQ